MSAAGTASTGLNLKEQADFVVALCDRARMADGNIAHEAWLKLGPDEVQELGLIAARLRRLAPHEPAIRRMVNGR